MDADYKDNRVNTRASSEDLEEVEIEEIDEDLEAIARRRKEPVLSFEDVIEDLGRRGRI